jgi:HSP20 family protein
MAEGTKLPVRTESKPPAAAGRSPFETFRREIDRLFDTFPGFPGGRRAFDLDLAWPREAAWPVMPAVDLAEKNGAYEISAELPGMDEKDIEVKVSNGTLTIKGEKKEEKEERDKDFYLSERRYGSFARSFEVPAGVDPAHIEARFAKGVLTVTLPKSPEAKQNEKKIEVKAA